MRKPMERQEKHYERLMEAKARKKQESKEKKKQAYQSGGQNHRRPHLLTTIESPFHRGSKKKGGKTKM